jgi:IS5 family transposase
MKIQVLINGMTRKIMSVHSGKGSEHDFAVYKRTVAFDIHANALLYADSGYQGIEAFHEKSMIPIKARPKQEQSKKDRAYNKRLSKKRVRIEHTNAKIKTFKIMSYPYRNRRTRHFLRASLICSVINFELK